jgi:hypothetical protein
MFEKYFIIKLSTVDTGKCLEVIGHQLKKGDAIINGITFLDEIT